MSRLFFAFVFLTISVLEDSSPPSRRSCFCLCFYVCLSVSSSARFRSVQTVRSKRVPCTVQESRVLKDNFFLSRYFFPHRRSSRALHSKTKKRCYRNNDRTAYSNRCSWACFLINNRKGSDRFDSRMSQIGKSCEFHALHQYFAGHPTGGLVAEWLACWTQAQKVPGSNSSHDAVGYQS